ncbi:ABC transporter ATP-binding protein/permease [Chloroflexi bacterium TSY]|nr:ABC transporter ATP-binding protein/permease [Chloroflexi bacterium TSY]
MKLTIFPLKEYWELLARYLRHQRGYMALLTLLILSSTAIYIINPQFMRYFIDVATGSIAAENPTQALFLAGLAFLGGAFLTQILWVASGYVGQRIGWVSTNQLRRDLAEHCLHLDMDFHNQHTPGEFIERIDGDVSTLANFFSDFTIEVIGKIIMVAGILAFLFREDWRVGAVLTGFALIMLLVLLRTSNLAASYFQKMRDAQANLYGYIEERLAGTEDVRSCGAVAYTMLRFYQAARKLYRSELKAELVDQFSWSTAGILITIGNVTALLMGAYLLRTGDLTIGAVYLIFHYTTMLEGPVRRLSNELSDLQRANAGIARIQEFMKITPGIQPGQRVIPSGPLHVRFENVSFAYGTTPADASPSVPVQLSSTRPNVLSNLSFELAPGSVLGLLGRTGSGKTTITRLLTRLYELQQGRVTLGSTGIESIELQHTELDSLRQRVGMVTQNVQLFNSTVRDNLTFFDPTVSDAAILSTLDDLQLTPWLRGLPNGLDTVLDAGGAELSTGQAQLLAFARVFLRDPGLVILDEASAHLDPATEQQIEVAIDKLLQNRTAIIIAHRLSTVQRADTILILDEGRIQEMGSRAQLATDPDSRFYHLLQTGLTEVLA